MATTYSGNKAGTAFIPTVAKPIDIRTVVDSIDDLTNKSISYLYQGIVVNVKGTGDLYVLKTNAMQATKLSSWEKVGNVEINPEDNLTYYEEKLGAKILNSSQELSQISNPFTGLFAYVKDNPDTSEDESGLYIYTGQGWKKIFTGSGSGSGLTDFSQIITSDGTIPGSGNGFSINGNDPYGYVEEIYADSITGFEGGKYYTGLGLNSSTKNGGTLEDVESITLTKGGSSYIKFNSVEDNNWLELHIEDDSLGFTKEDVTYVDGNGDVQHLGEETDYVFPKGVEVSFGQNTVSLVGMSETRYGDNTVYIFGDTGSTYEDIDVYSSSVLPTVYAYSNNNPVRILTDGDRTELISKIEENSVDFTIKNHTLYLNK